jgi:hypothetical protein
LLRIFHQDKPANKRTRGLAEGTFAKCRPEIDGRAKRFLSPIVEVVAEGWSHLRLQLERRNQTRAIDNQQIPEFRRAEKPRQSTRRPIIM